MPAFHVASPMRKHVKTNGTPLPSLASTSCNRSTESHDLEPGSIAVGVDRVPCWPPRARCPRTVAAIGADGDDRRNGADHDGQRARTDAPDGQVTVLCMKEEQEEADDRVFVKDISPAQKRTMWAMLRRKSAPNRRTKCLAGAPGFRSVALEGGADAEEHGEEGDELPSKRKRHVDAHDGVEGTWPRVRS